MSNLFNDEYFEWTVIHRILVSMGSMEKTKVIKGKKKIKRKKREKEKMKKAYIM